ncbi:hypothetical protein [Prosthecobacter sp.]|uniref:hypothetical protein n=1 Tax=Prosthecobacter sp. TaxID=1965333 RepID=UPI0037839572
MKTFKLGVTSGICIVLAWSLFSSAFLQHASGTHGYGGFPAARCKELHDYLSGQGFVLDPAYAHSERAKPQQKFHGIFHGSRPFDVTVFGKTADNEGVYVETAYDFRGSSWSVKDSSKKAQEFALALDRWMSERQKSDLNAGL